MIFPLAFGLLQTTISVTNKSLWYLHFVNHRDCRLQ